MSVYDELIQLQHLPHAFSAWSEYRAVLTDYILANTAPDTSIAVFGAGCCNDIDLARFSTHFSSVTLLDSDADAMKHGIAQYKLTDCPHIHTISSDFTGITADDYRALSDELAALLHVRGSMTEIRVLADYALFKLEQLYRKAASAQISFGERSYDYTMTFGVHSQLNNMPSWIWSAFCANLHVTEDSVPDRIRRENAVIIPRFNDAILRATKQCAFFGCELSDSRSQGAIAGAVECIRDLKQRGLVRQQLCIDWPFDVTQGLVYRMLIQECVP